MKGKTGWLATLACVCVAGGLAAAAGASTAGHAAGTGVSIYSWPRGYFGEVTSPRPGTCARDRRVVVLRQRGRYRNPRRDKRIATVRATRTHGLYEWYVNIHGAGSFYAEATRSRGCRAGFSKSARFEMGTGNGDVRETSSVPICSPYVGQGPSTICKFKDPLLHLQGSEKHGLHCSKSFDTAQASCYGFAVSGPFPWGVLGGFQRDPYAELDWNWGTHTVLYVDYDQNPQDYSAPGLAHLGGTMPGPSSDAFTIKDGFAVDNRGYPNGPHFFTPDIPGQAPGEEGGPLHFRYEREAPALVGEAFIYGYLYLKR